VLLRISPRKTLCELTDVDEVLKTAFKTRTTARGLELSTYQVQAADEVERVMAEHAAAMPLDPPRGSGAFELEGLAQDVEPAPPKRNVFAFLSAAHRNAFFQNNDALHAAVSQVLLNRRIVTKPDAAIAAYARLRIQSIDAEWTNALGHMDESRRRRWHRFCGLTYPPAPTPGGPADPAIT